MEVIVGGEIFSLELERVMLFDVVSDFHSWVFRAAFGFESYGRYSDGVDTYRWFYRVIAL